MTTQHLENTDSKLMKNLIIISAIAGVTVLILVAVTFVHIIQAIGVYTA